MVSKGRQAEREKARVSRRPVQGTVVYFEGGAKGDPAKRARIAFQKLFDYLKPKPRFVACGSRKAAYDRFAEHLGKSGESRQAVLLVDSEEPLASGPWLHVLNRKGDGWTRPEGATDCNLCFMAVVMETWCLADGSALGFDVKYKPPAKLESMAKDDVYDELAELSNGQWSKESKMTSFDFVERLRPSELLKRCAEFKRLEDELKR